MSIIATGVGVATLRQVVTHDEASFTLGLDATTRSVMGVLRSIIAVSRLTSLADGQLRVFKLILETVRAERISNLQVILRVVEILVNKRSQLVPILGARHRTTLERLHAAHSVAFVQGILGLVLVVLSV